MAINGKRWMEVEQQNAESFIQKSCIVYRLEYVCRSNAWLAIHLWPIYFDSLFFHPFFHVVVGYLLIVSISFHRFFYSLVIIFLLFSRSDFSSLTIFNTHFFWLVRSSCLSNKKKSHCKHHSSKLLWAIFFFFVFSCSTICFFSSENDVVYVKRGEYKI